EFRRVLFRSEVNSLKAQLNEALKNKPRERQAQIVANAIVKAKQESTPQIDPADLKKIKGQALTEARIRTGAKKSQITPTDKEWEAIQSGAVSSNMLKKIMANRSEERRVGHEPA